MSTRWCRPKIENCFEYKEFLRNMYKYAVRLILHHLRHFFDDLFFSSFSGSTSLHSCLRLLMPGNLFSNLKYRSSTTAVAVFSFLSTFASTDFPLPSSDPLRFYINFWENWASENKAKLFRNSTFPSQACFILREILKHALAITLASVFVMKS